MPQRLRLVVAAATLGLIAVTVPAAAATASGGLSGSRLTLSTQLSPTTQLRTVARPKPSPTSTATPTASTTPTASASPTGCRFPTVTFNGTAYCPATIVDVRNTAYGAGARVVLKAVTVTAVTTSTVTVAAWTSTPCPPGNFCGATMTLESLTVAWTGTGRPAYGDVLDLFGLTVSASITPTGYIKTGNCPIDLC